MFEQLTPSQKRHVLLTSRIRFGAEFKFPRQKVVDKMIENALFVARSDEWFTPTHVLQAFKEIGGLPTLRLLEVEGGLDRLLKAGLVESRGTWPRLAYRLSGTAWKEVETEFKEVSDRLHRVLISLYADVLDGEDPLVLAPFFLEFVCEIFSALGAQWASYLKGAPIRSFIDFEAVEKISQRMLYRHKVPKNLHSDVRRRSVYFFEHTDPDHALIKFSLGQTFYVAQLLGIEDKDYLSEELFSGGTLFLDSNVLVPALLEGARHHAVFRELQKVCKRLNINLKALRPTVDEVRRVAADQEKIAPKLYDRVPESLALSIRGDFFYAYLERKKVNAETPVQDLFQPFHELADTLRSELEIEVVDSAKFEDFVGTTQYETAKGVLQDCSNEVRKRPKYENALAHDAQVFLFLQSEFTNPRQKIWLLTRDSSLPSAWAKLQPAGMLIRCFLLDGLLQSISPFVVADEDIGRFSTVFSQVVAAQLLPQAKLFVVDDFMVFEDLDLDCREMTDDEISEGLIAIKQHVLKGASYKHENIAEAAYQLRRMFMRKRDSIQALAKERERLEKIIESKGQVLAEQEKSHAQEVNSLKARYDSTITTLQTQVTELAARESSRQNKRKSYWLAFKKLLSILLLVFIGYLVTSFANEYGAGENLPRRALSFWAFYGVAFVFWLLVVKRLLFRRERLRDVFRDWSEIRELLR
jgi:hypothetical protein